jgi:hypothetical protein
MSPPLLRARTLTVRSDCSGGAGGLQVVAHPAGRGVRVQPDGGAREMPTSNLPMAVVLPAPFGPITAHCSSDSP